METERWRWIRRLKGLYKVSDYGRVKSVRRQVIHGSNHNITIGGKILKPWVGNKWGHLYVSLYKNGRSRKLIVSRLVLETYKGPCPFGMQACHFPERDVDNNRADNLIWGTSKDNHDHMKPQGTSCRRKNYDNVPKGENHPFAKLSDKAVRLIKRILNKNHKRGMGRKIAKLFDVSESTICDITKGRTRSN